MCMALEALSMPMHKAAVVKAAVAIVAADQEPSSKRVPRLVVEML